MLSNVSAADLAFLLGARRFEPHPGRVRGLYGDKRSKKNNCKLATRPTLAAMRFMLVMVIIIEAIRSRNSNPARHAEAHTYTNSYTPATMSVRRASTKSQRKSLQPLYTFLTPTSPEPKP